MENLNNEIIKIDNPFITSSLLVHFDELSNSNIELDSNNISKYYDTVFILIKKNNFIIPSEFYNLKVSVDIFNTVANNLILYKTSINILKNEFHFNNILILSSDKLINYNIFNYKLNNNNIILPIFNITLPNIIKYLEQYESNYTLDNLYNLIIINNYFSVNNYLNKYKLNDYISNFINNLEESNYWSNYYNCLLNITKYFYKRKFVLEPARLSDNNLSDIIKKINNHESQIINNTISPQSTINYINNITTKNKFVDISCILNKKDIKYYSIDKTICNFSKNDINNLFDNLNEKQKYLLFSHLTISKKYCHLVINNIYILELMQSIILEFTPLFRYLFSYAWIRFYSEECIKKSNIKTTDDFIFDINTTALLPIFIFDHLEPTKNPYMPLLVAHRELKPSINFCSIKEHNNGICNLKQFRERLNIFCTSNMNYNIFENFDFQKYNVAITGSIMTACIQHTHPLMTIFKNSQKKDNFNKYITESYNNFFNEYYSNADIDIMFMVKNNYIFFDNVKEFYNQIVTNICKLNNLNDNNNSHTKLIINKLGYLYVSENFIINNIELNNYQNDKVQYIFDNINSTEIKNKFRPFYINMIKEKYNELIKNYSYNYLQKMINKYPDIFNQDINIDFKIYINKDTKKSIDLIYTYKFNIISQYINHTLELFSINCDDFFGVVSKFHLPCVRAYYNGINVYLTPSCISAHLTYMNIDYKYFAGTKDPFDIINKYRERGFGTWLNKNELQLMNNYCRNVLVWSKLYYTDTINDIHIYGILSLNHKLFKPRLYNYDNYNNDNININDRYNMNIPVLPNKLKFNSSVINYDNFISIDKNGFIIPVKKWIILTAWNLTREMK